MTETAATSRVFALNTSRALSASLTTYFEYFTLLAPGGVPSQTRIV